VCETAREGAGSIRWDRIVRAPLRLLSVALATVALAATPGTIAYEAYFNKRCRVESNLYRPAGSGCARQNTTAGAVYQSLWRA